MPLLSLSPSLQCRTWKDAAGGVTVLLCLHITAAWGCFCKLEPADKHSQPRASCRPAFFKNTKELRVLVAQVGHSSSWLWKDFTVKPKQADSLKEESKPSEKPPGVAFCSDFDIDPRSRNRGRTRSPLSSSPRPEAAGRAQERELAALGRQPRSLRRQPRSTGKTPRG